MPPIASRPWLVTVASSTNSTMPSTISISPARLSGRLPNPMKARMIASAPRMPVTKLGCSSSMIRPRVPIVNSRKAMFGSESRCSRPWNGFMSCSSTPTPSSARVVVVPATVTSLPLAWPSTSSSVAAIPSTAPAATASLAEYDLASRHGGDRPRHRPAARLRDRRHVGDGVVLHLLAERAGDVLAVAVDRRGGPDVRAGRHVGEVRRHRDERAGARRPAAARA